MEVEEKEKKTLKNKVKKVKEKAIETKDNLKEKVKTKKTKEQIKPLVTCRVLFITVLDKILLLYLAIPIVAWIIAMFTSDGRWIYSSYIETVVFTGLTLLFTEFINYLLFNWLYKCAAKTMLCVTDKEVYKETYFPFNRMETSIPLNKITGVTTYNFLYIFRSVIIHQYGKLPIVFFTWNNQEFKNKLNELITKNEYSIENEFKNKNLLSKKHYKYLLWLLVVLIVVALIAGVRAIIANANDPEKKVPGTYVYEDKEIYLYDDYYCNIDDLQDNVTDCSWDLYESLNTIEISYDYTYKSKYSYSSYTYSNTIEFEYNEDDGTLYYEGNYYTKKSE